MLAALFTAVLLVLAYALAGRYARSFHATAIWAACLAGVGFILTSWPGVAVAAGWWLWRSWPWSAPDIPITGRDHLKVFGRHAAPMVLATAVLGFGAILTFLTWAAFATAVSNWRGGVLENAYLADDLSSSASVDEWANLFLGVAFGLAAWVAL